MITDNKTKYDSLKFSNLVNLQCDCCGKTYQKTKRQVYHNNRRVTSDGFFNKTACSKECQNEVQHKNTTVVCRFCKKPFTVIMSKYLRRYCSQHCANSDRNQTDITKEKIKTSLQIYRVNHPVSIKPPMKLNCTICKKIFENHRHKKTCSLDCLNVQRKRQGEKAGRISAAKMYRRSKNEIKLYDLLSQIFICKANEPMFNGWDADIIIPSIKLAILWNGAWHYTQLKKSHSVLQVQNRDTIKLKEIQKCGFNFIVIKDYKNKMTPQKAFDLIKDKIKSNEFNLTLF
jgi:hypothetical protein